MRRWRQRRLPVLGMTDCHPAVLGALAGPILRPPPDDQPPVVGVMGVKGEAERVQRTRSALDARHGDHPPRSAGGGRNLTTEEGDKLVKRKLGLATEAVAMPASAALPMLLTTVDVARMCRVHPSTVLRWRQVGEGPPVIWVSSHIPRYAPDQVAAWLQRVAA